VTAPYIWLEVVCCGGVDGLGGGAELEDAEPGNGLMGEAGFDELEAVEVAEFVPPLLIIIGKSSKLIRENCGFCPFPEIDNVSLKISLPNSSIFMVPLRPSLRLFIIP
jgi:hypothetical protein